MHLRLQVLADYISRDIGPWSVQVRRSPGQGSRLNVTKQIKKTIQFIVLSSVVIQLCVFVSYLCLCVCLCVCARCGWVHKNRFNCPSCFKSYRTMLDLAQHRCSAAAKNQVGVSMMCVCGCVYLVRVVCVGQFR